MRMTDNSPAHNALNEILRITNIIDAQRDWLVYHINEGNTVEQQRTESILVDNIRLLDVLVDAFLPPKDDINSVLRRRVDEEINRQNEIWGEQNHPLIPLEQIKSPTFQSFYKKAADEWKSKNRKRAWANWIGWDGILLEEVYEALSAETIADQIAELVQVAAVAISAAASLQRNS